MDERSELDEMAIRAMGERDLGWSLHRFGLLLVLLDDRARVVAVALVAGAHGVTIARDQVDRRLQQKRETSARKRAA